MKKINYLYNYLIKNNYSLEAKYLHRVAAAIDEEKYKQEYSVIYEAWQDRSNNDMPDKPWHAYANILKNLEEKGIVIEKNIAYLFDELKDLLTKEKEQVKTEKQDEILEYLKQNLRHTFHLMYPNNQRALQEDLNLAKQKGLNKEEILYLVNDQQNHTWFEKVDVASRFNNAKSTAFPEEDKNKTIMDFQNIDEVLDFMQSRLNKAPVDLEQFYADIEQQALATSATVYNSNNYLVKHSKSMEAAQYWEQSCVTVDKEGKVTAGTCTSRITDNYFNYYDKNATDTIHSFQIITKEYKTQTETPRTSFKDKNKFFNFISLSISKYSGKVKWGNYDTVNRLNKPVYSCDLLFTLKDEYDAIVNAISNYCKNHYNLEPSYSFSSKDECETMLNDGEYEVFFDLSLDDIYPEKISIHLKKLPSHEYFEYKLDDKYKGEKYEDILKKQLEKIDNDKYFRLKLDDKYKKEFYDIFIKNLNEIEPYGYFNFNLDDKYKGEKYKDILKKKLDQIGAYNYFSKYFKLYEKYKGEKYQDILKDKLNRMNPEDYFYLRLDEKYKGEKYKNILEKYLNKISSHIYFESKLDEKYNDEKYKNILKEKLEKANPRFYFSRKLDEKYNDEKYQDILKEQLKKIRLEDYLEFKLDKKYGDKNT